MYVYPDVMAICGPVVTMEGRPNVVTNPVFVAEVLSPGTAADDRGVKSHEYRATPSILQFALLSQNRPLVEIHTRQGWELVADGGDRACGGVRVFGAGVPGGDGGAVRGVLDLLE